MANIFLYITADVEENLSSRIEKRLRDLGHYITYKSLNYVENNITDADMKGIMTADIIIFFLVHDAPAYVEDIFLGIRAAAQSRLDPTFILVTDQPDQKSFKDYIENQFDLESDWSAMLPIELERLMSFLEIFLPSVDPNSIEDIKRVEEIKSNIKVNAKEFFDEATESLENRGTELNKYANAYFMFGGLAILFCIVFAWITKVELNQYVHLLKTWPTTAFILVKGLVLISLFVAFANHSLKLGKAYMHESLKIKERMHAISFGKFYLNVYEGGVTQDDFKEIFRDWNLSNHTTAFGSTDKDDIKAPHEQAMQLLDKAKDIVKAGADTIKAVKE